MKIATTTGALIAALACGWSGNTAHAEASIYELRISNGTGTDLTFRLHEGQSKHARLVYDKKEVSSYTISAGQSATIGVQATRNKCSTNCGACTPTVGKVYAYYTDGHGDEQRNNYYEPSIEFFEYCGVAGSKPITTYTSNWTFDHGTGKGTGEYDHSQKSSSNSYTSSNAGKGLTVDGKYISGHATITYSE
ncbi:MAG: hypothetical protein NXH78_02885 [Hyphomonadaceae bacterium]|nr:hypothetical protein [Hyphomonadaceae bacterium]